MAYPNKSWNGHVQYDSIAELECPPARSTRHVTEPDASVFELPADSVATPPLGDNGERFDTISSNPVQANPWPFHLGDAPYADQSRVTDNADEDTSTSWQQPANPWPYHGVESKRGEENSDMRSPGNEQPQEDLPSAPSISADGQSSISAALVTGQDGPTTEESFAKEDEQGIKGKIQGEDMPVDDESGSSASVLAMSPSIANQTHDDQTSYHAVTNSNQPEYQNNAAVESVGTLTYLDQRRYPTSPTASGMLQPEDQSTAQSPVSGGVLHSKVEGQSPAASEPVRHSHVPSHPPPPPPYSEPLPAGSNRDDGSADFGRGQYLPPHHNNTQPYSPTQFSYTPPRQQFSPPVSEPHLQAPPLPPRSPQQGVPLVGFSNGPHNSVAFPPPPRRYNVPPPRYPPPLPQRPASSSSKFFGSSSAKKWLDKTNQAIEDTLDAVLQGPAGPPGRPAYVTNPGQPSQYAGPPPPNRFQYPPHSPQENRRY